VEDDPRFAEETLAEREGHARIVEESDPVHPDEAGHAGQDEEGAVEPDDAGTRPPRVIAETEQQGFEEEGIDRKERTGLLGKGGEEEKERKSQDERDPSLAGLKDGFTAAQIEPGARDGAGGREGGFPLDDVEDRGDIEREEEPGRDRGERRIVDFGLAPGGLPGIPPDPEQRPRESEEENAVQEVYQNIRDLEGKRCGAEERPVEREGEHADRAPQRSRIEGPGRMHDRAEA